jgi:hypothetical protein
MVVNLNELLGGLLRDQWWIAAADGRQRLTHGRA